MNAPYQASTPGYLDVQVNATPEMIAMAQEWFGFLSNPLLAPVYNRHTIMSASMSVAHTTSAPVVYDNVTYTTVCEVAPATTRHAVAPMTFVPSTAMTSVCQHRPRLTMDHAPQPPVSASAPQRHHIQKREQQLTLASQNAAHSSSSSNRSIFLTGLSWDLTEPSLKRLLQRYGTVEDCDMHWDHRKKRGKGTATARFSSQEEAAAAIDGLNGRRLGNGPREVSARWDKESSEGVVVRDAGGGMGRRVKSGQNGQSGRRGEMDSTAGCERSNREGEKERDRHADQRSNTYEGPVIVNGARGYRGSESDRKSRSNSESGSEGEGMLVSLYQIWPCYPDMRHRGSICRGQYSETEALWSLESWMVSLLHALPWMERC